MWEAGTREPTLVDLVEIARVIEADPGGLLDGLPAGRGSRRASSRAYGWRLRGFIGFRLAIERDRKAISFAEASIRLGIGGLRLGRLESGADASVAELAGLRALLEFAPARLLAAAKLDSYRELHSLDR